MIINALLLITYQVNLLSSTICFLSSWENKLTDRTGCKQTDAKLMLPGVISAFRFFFSVEGMCLHCFANGGSIYTETNIGLLWPKTKQNNEI